jgi:predicted nucleotidyltransferase
MCRETNTVAMAEAASENACRHGVAKSVAMEISIPRQRIAEFCRRHHVRRLSLFGSVLRDDFRPDSDIDVLVEFEPGKTPGRRFFAMQEELSEMLGRKVDLNTPNFLSRHVRDQVMAEASIQYAASP